MIMPWYRIWISRGNSRRILHLIRTLRMADVDIYVLEAIPYTLFNKSIQLMQNIDVYQVNPSLHIYIANYVIKDKDSVSNYIIRAYLLLRLFLRFLQYRKLLRNSDLVHVPDSSVEFVVLAYVISRLLGRKLIITFQLVPRYLKELTINESLGLFRSALRHYLYVKGEEAITSLIKSLVLWLYVNVIKRAYA